MLEYTWLVAQETARQVLCSRRAFRHAAQAIRALIVHRKQRQPAILAVRPANGILPLHAPALAHPGVGKRILHCHILITAVRPHRRLGNLWAGGGRQHKTAVIQALQHASSASQCACTGSAQRRASATGASEARILKSRNCRSQAARKHLQRVAVALWVHTRVVQRLQIQVGRACKHASKLTCYQLAAASSPTSSSA